jgi:hypothetical protein
MPRTFQDFSLTITSDGLYGFKVSVHSQQTGSSGQVSLSPPPHPGDLNSLSRDDRRKVGRKLFAALFPVETKELWGRFLRETKGKADHGLRLNLYIDLNDPRLARLAGLPWELIRDKEFLLLNPANSLVRRIDPSASASVIPIRPPLRVLVVSSGLQEGEPRIDADREWRQLAEIWRKQRPSVDLILLKQPTLAQLGEKLRTGGPVHVLHFIGHGRFAEEEGEGYFSMVKEGRPQKVSGEGFMHLLTAHPELRLVVLNACWTARFPLQANLNPFSGVAHAVIEAGIPAVVAMQSWIKDEEAVLFSKGFHSRIAEGDSIDDAMAQGRREVYLNDPNSFGWAAPVLYLLSGGEEIPRFIAAHGQSLAPVNHQPVEEPASPKENEDSPLPVDRPPRRVVAAALLAVTLMPAALLRSGPLPPSPCRGVQIARVELDLPGGTRVLDLAGNRVTRLTAADLRGSRSLTGHLTGRAVLAGASECTCTWRGGTDRDLAGNEISASPDGCDFQMNLPQTYSWIELRLFLGSEPHLFTIELP